MNNKHQNRYQKNFLKHRKNGFIELSIKNLALIAVAACVVSLPLFYLVFSASSPVLPPNKTLNVTIDAGMTTHEIADVLYQKGIITSPLKFRALTFLAGLGNSLKAGEYALTSAMPEKEIIQKMAKGEVSYKEITIPEGYSVEQIARLIEEKKLGKASTFKAIAKEFSPPEYARSDKNTTYRIEGYLFPDTYRISKGMSEEQIIKMLVGQFQKQFTNEMQEKAKTRGLTVKDAIILASLVEREAKYAEERPVIAGVFINRLKNDMPLQSCATIQYILGEPKEELSIQDTEIPSPYNTYLHAGLPPGPIGNPGLASIKAVLQPTSTDYLYFVADHQGHHTFSVTYEEHLIAVQKVR